MNSSAKQRYKSAHCHSSTTLSRSVPVACWLAASRADSLWGWTMWNRDTRLTASWSLETSTHTLKAQIRAFASRYNEYILNVTQF